MEERLTNKEKKMTQHLFNKIILFTAHTYFGEHKKEAKLPEKAKKIDTALNMFTKTTGFLPDEVKTIQSHNKEVQEITRKEVSYIVFALHLLKLWSDKIPKSKRFLAINDKHLKYSKAMFTTEMLTIKHTNKEVYEEKKQIIDDSIKIAEDFFNYHYNKLKSK